MIDIASVAQRSSLARNPFPLSRESSGINLRDVIPPPARNLRPKINISRIGKTFQGFNIINKVGSPEYEPLVIAEVSVLKMHNFK